MKEIENCLLAMEKEIKRLQAENKRLKALDDAAVITISKMADHTKRLKGALETLGEGVQMSNALRVVISRGNYDLALKALQEKP